MDPLITRLREAAPYINAHRGRTFVIWLSGTAFEKPDFDHLLHDFCLLISLGVRLVMVFGTSQQVQRRLDELGMETRWIDGQRVTSPEVLDIVQEVTGRLRSRMEASLSGCRVDSPAQGASLRVISGNFVKARPVGVLDGVDFQHAGRIRRIEVPALRQHLLEGNLVLVPPLGYSVIGEVLNLNSADIATRLAIGLGASKLLFLRPEQGIRVQGDLRSELRPDEIDQLLSGEALTADDRTLLRLARTACNRGVARCHFVSCVDDGALLQELFTREGVGTQISQHSPEQLRPANVEDIPSIIKLIEPLEEAGVLVQRSREGLEMEIDHFTVIDKDGLIIATGALHPFGSSAEIACLATHQDYRNADRGDSLINHLEESARQRGFESTFILTTQSADWFRERGYELSELSSLPSGRQELYSHQRSSKAYFKRL